jgi:hypothetical protein
MLGQSAGDSGLPDQNEFRTDLLASAGYIFLLCPDDNFSDSQGDRGEVLDRHVSLASSVQAPAGTAELEPDGRNTAAGGWRVGGMLGEERERMGVGYSGSSLCREGGRNKRCRQAQPIDKGCPTRATW